MLFLLRQARRKLLMNNKITTYLLYAVGEIVLVVFGILIAVQIDNWNESRKEKDADLILLKNLKNEFLLNKQILERTEKSLINSSSSIEALLGLFGSSKIAANKNELDSLLNRCFTAPTAAINDGVFRSITNSGKLDLLENDKLKGLLLYWGSSIDLFKVEENNMYRNLNQNVVPFMEEHISFLDIEKFSSVPKNEFMRSSIAFDNRVILNNYVVENKFFNHLWEIQYVKNFYPLLYNLIDQILLELDTIDAPSTSKSTPEPDAEK